MKKNKYTIFLMIFGIFLIFGILNHMRSTLANDSNSTSKVSFDVSNVTSSVTTFNRYTIIYSSDVYVKGVITYKIDGVEESERLYLEPGKNSTFSSFISGYIDERSVKANDLVSIEFEKISSEEGSFTINSVELLLYPKAHELIDWINGDLAETDSIYDDQKTIFIGNDNVKLGLSLRYGGSINYISGGSNIFSENFADINLINNYDNGRLVQQCYYGNQTYSGDGNRFVSGACDNINGLYNPIQGGYVKRNCAKTVDSDELEEYNSKIIDIGISEDKKTIVIKTKPSLWEVTNKTYKADFYDYYGGYTTEAYMTSEFTVYDTYIDASNSYIDFTDNFSDTYSTVEERRGSVRSESPSVYTISALDTFYKNNIATSTIEKISLGEKDASGFQSLNNGNVIYTNWGGYYATNSETNITEGIGLYYPNYDGSYQYISGFVFPGQTTSTSSTADSTSFFSMIIHLKNGLIDKFKEFSYDYIITLGNVNNTRKIMNTYRSDHTYTLKVNPNGGTINGSNNTVVYEPKLIAYWGNWNTIGVATRTGYTLTGYYDSSTDGNKVYDSTGTAYNGLYWKVNGDNLVNESLVEEKYKYIGNKDITVYARWTANELTFSNQTFSKTYNSSSQQLSFSGAGNGTGSYTYSITGGNSSNYFSISGTTITLSEKIPSGTYALTVKATDNNSGKTKSATITINVNKASTTIPTASTHCNAVTYNGTSQTITKASGAGYTFDITSGTDAKEYTITATLKSNYIWSDGDTGTKTFKCSINKASCACKINSTPTLKYPGSSTDNITYNCDGDGIIDVASADTDIITVGTIGDKSTTLTAKAIGSSKITVSQAAGKNYNICTTDSETVSIGGTTYIITLNGNGATTEGTTSITATYNSSTIKPTTITLPKRIYTVSGFETSDSRNSTSATISSTSNLTSTYTFNGWYTAKSDGSQIINNSSTPAFIASVSGYTNSIKQWARSSATTLYAQWSSESVSLPTITKTGYTCGWTTSKTATTISYESGTSYIPDENTTMYAVCIPDTNTKYTVKHYKMNLSGKYNTTADEIQNLTGTTDANVTPNVKTYIGFTSPTTKTVTISGDGSTLIEYYYTRNKYTLTLIAGNGIETVTGAGKYYYEQEVEVNATVKAGYTFKSWTSGDTSLSITYKIPAENSTLTANTTVNTYKITYQLNGGRVSVANPSEYTVESADIILNNPTKVGYTFKEWQENGTKTAGIILKGTTGNKTFTAIYEANSGTLDKYLYFDESLEINKENKYINISENKLTVSEILGKIEVIESNIKIVLCNNNEVSKSNTDIIATGDILTVYIDNEEKDRYVISVLGDITGDGEISTADVSKLFQYYRKEITMNEIYILAGDVKEDNEIKLTDVTKLFQYIRKKINNLR